MPVPQGRFEYRGIIWDYDEVASQDWRSSRQPNREASTLGAGRLTRDLVMIRDTQKGAPPKTSGHLVPPNSHSKGAYKIMLGDVAGASDLKAL